MKKHPDISKMTKTLFCTILLSVLMVTFSVQGRPSLKRTVLLKEKQTDSKDRRQREDVRDHRRRIAPARRPRRWRRDRVSRKYCLSTRAARERSKTAGLLGALAGEDFGELEIQGSSNPTRL